MRRTNQLLAFLTLVAIGCVATLTKADTFGSGANSFDIEFVPIDDPGNPADSNPNPAGAVSYRYRMGKYEVSEQMIDKANALGGLGISKDTRGPNMPATGVTWFEAAKFVNWLNASEGFTPAYKFDGLGAFQLWQPGDLGFNPANLFRNKRARYFLPSIDEWHKAAYYDPVAGAYYDYPTGSDNIPDGIDFIGDSAFDAVFFDGASNQGPNEITNVGISSAYATFGQGGNIREWQETAFDRMNSNAIEQRATPGGGWNDISNVLHAANTGIGVAPSFAGDFIGFRVVGIPEPPSLLLVLVGVFEIFRWRRRASI
jgi:formylglycine-generating enzyme required for sulfatase activity